VKTEQHRALADPHRASILGLLRESGPLGVAELAELVALHANTVRWHLGVLAQAGLVTSRPDPRGTPGRPRVVFEANGRDGAPAREDYRLLATMLAGSLAGAPDGPARAEEAGREWGRYLVERPPPFVPTSEADAVTRVCALLAEHGFEPEAQGRSVRMRRCPFRALAETHGQVVCTLHRGLLGGALAELRAPLEVESLDAFVEPSLCVATLAPPGG
jgi:predicted ArsR family transcriptional regulator